MTDADTSRFFRPVNTPIYDMVANGSLEQAVKERGICTVCCRSIQLRRDGKIGPHGDGNFPPGNCRGWGHKPQSNADTRQEEAQ